MREPLFYILLSFAGLCLFAIVVVVLTRKKTIKVKYDDIDKVKSKFQINKSGQKDGKETIFDRDGRKNKVSHWKDGVRDGKFIVYWKNGRKYITGAYKDGRLYGDYVVYDRKGWKVIYRKCYE